MMLTTLKALLVAYINQMLSFLQSHQALIIKILIGVFFIIIVPVIVKFIGSYAYGVYTTSRDNKVLRANIITTLNEADKMLDKTLFREALDCYKRIERDVSKDTFPDLYGHLKYKMSHCLSELAYEGNRESNLLLAINLDEEALIVLKKMVVTDQMDLLQGLSALYLALSTIKETENIKTWPLPSLISLRRTSLQERLKRILHL